MLLIKFSLHGSGIFIKGFPQGNHVWRTFSLYSENELNKILFNHNLFSKLNLKNNEGKNISSYHELIPDENSACYCIDRFTVLEIKINGKRYGRIGLYDLVRSDILFSPFPITYSEFQIKGLNIIESDIGNFGSVTLKVESFDIRSLRFELMKIQGKSYVSKIIYKNIALEFRNSDTLNQANYILKQDDN
jgi:hypothetical protein